MNEVNEASLRQWFISLGYPVQEAAQTDWNTLCRGKMPMFWKKAAKVIKSKQEINNIRRNVLLKETKQFLQRESSSAAKLGIILPPSEIHYVKEQEKLQRKLDSIQSGLQKKLDECKTANDERKRKCFEINELKHCVLTIEREIYSRKLTMQKLKDDVSCYKKHSKTITNFKDSFEYVNTNGENVNFTKNEHRDIKNLDEKKYEDFQRFLSSCCKTDNSKSSFDEAECDSSTEKSFLTNNSLNATVICNGSKSFDSNPMVEKMHTSKLLHLILEYYGDISNIVEQNATNLSLTKSKKLNHTIANGHYASFKNGISNFNLVHSQLVIETLLLIRDYNKINETSSLFKSKILDKLSKDSTKLELFQQQCSLMCNAIYKDRICSELTDLKSLTGFYSNFHNKLQLNNIDNFENSILAFENAKDKYLQKYLSCKSKIKHVLDSLDEIKCYNNKIQENIVHIIENNRPGKVLWNSEYKALQEIYMKVILKNPNTFKIENETAFEALIYLQSIIFEFNLDSKLPYCAKILTNEIDWIKVNGDRSTNIFKSIKTKHANNEEGVFNDCNILLCYNRIEYLRPLRYFIFTLAKRLKFISTCELTNSVFELNSTEDMTASDLENNLAFQEEKLLAGVENLKSSKIEFILKDFYDVHEFFIKFSKVKDSIDD